MVPWKKKRKKKKGSKVSKLHPEALSLPSVYNFLSCPNLGFRSCPYSLILFRGYPWNKKLVLPKRKMIANVLAFLYAFLARNFDRKLKNLPQSSPARVQCGTKIATYIYKAILWKFSPHFAPYLPEKKQFISPYRSSHFISFKNPYKTLHHKTNRT